MSGSLLRIMGIGLFLTSAAEVKSNPAETGAAMQDRVSKSNQITLPGATVDETGVLQLPPISIPMSELSDPSSKDASVPSEVITAQRARQQDVIGHRKPTIKEVRQRFDDTVAIPSFRWLESHFPTRIDKDQIDGVPVEVFTPLDGVSPRNQHRLLINLHGGGFMAGAIYGGRIESMRLASTFRIRVISVDYRMGPEYKFPAASEDVATVYEHAIQQVSPKNVGIYGCSAGGYLTAQSVAWIIHEGLPSPGAAGILCASAIGWTAGDSGYLWPLERRWKPGSAVQPPAYLSNANLKDPLVSPGYSLDTLSKFPPTIILTSTRSTELSSAVFTDIQLRKAGVSSELHVWDGLNHSSFIWRPWIKEAEEANSFLIEFFDRVLGTEGHGASKARSR